MSKTTQAITTIKDDPATSHQTTSSVSSSNKWFKGLKIDKLIQKISIFGMVCCFVFLIIIILATYNIIHAPILLWKY